MSLARDDIDRTLYEAENGYLLDVRCPKCGHTWEAHFADDGLPSYWPAMLCDHCGEEGEPV